MAKYAVASEDEVPVGARKLVEAAGRQIALFNVGGEFFAIANRCPHEGASLCAGKIVGLAESPEPGKYMLSRAGEFVRCPWHGWEFDIRTGKSWCDPTRTKVHSFEVTVAPGERVQGPYEIETFQVAVEKKLIFVEV
jgi:nitrite reductase/ring-hydroxylating ferredoxin subunit